MILISQENNIMAFSKKDSDKIREIYHSTLDRANLTLEEVELACEWTLGDLIAHAYFTLDEASQFTRFIKLEARRHEAVGFRANNAVIVKESKQFINECDSMCKMAGLGGMQDDYHPVDNEVGGVQFEDNGPGEQAGMIKSNLYSIFTKAQSLHDTIGDTDQLPEWVQEKIAVADEMIDTIKDYLEYEYKRKG